MKLRLLIAILITLGIPALAPAQETSTLGLAERRALKEYQEKVFPEQLKAVQTAAGFEVPVEVQWEAIAQPGQADNYMDEGYFTNIYFQPLAMAFTEITKDDMGKQALAAKLKQIVLTYDDETAPVSNYPTGVSFEEGVLKINFRPYSNVADTKDRADAIRSVIEPKL